MNYKLPKIDIAKLTATAIREMKGHLIPDSGRKKAAQRGPLGMGALGFMAPELAQFAYALFTAFVIFFTWTNIEDPSALLWQRISFLSGTIALWIVYNIWPCRFMILMRVVYLLAMLGSWYPDTYDINCQFGSYDHIFAQMDQDYFDCQPSYLFSQYFPSAVVSELMYMGYFSYYLFFVVTTIYIYFRGYQQLERVTLIIFGGFFICYVIYVLLPVTGPQYYYQAAGLENIAAGKYPDIGTYFANTTECLTSPGWKRGLFYRLCHMAHDAGERPTAAFPSSHVAIATVVMCIVARMRMWRYLLFLAIPYAFLCMATVYIYAHYAVDAFAGFFFGIILFFLLGGWKLSRLS